jgi:hypothetical protein
MALENQEVIKDKLSGVLYSLDSTVIGVKDRIATLHLSVNDMKSYMDRKKMLGDWHAVMDAAADIREMVAEQNALRQVQVNLEKIIEGL